MNLPECRNTHTAAVTTGVISKHLPEYPKGIHTYSLRKCGL